MICPECSSKNLRVLTRVWALYEPDSERIYCREQTMPLHSINDDRVVECLDCEHKGFKKDF